jgi:hypothetical protein
MTSLIIDLEWDFFSLLFIAREHCGASRADFLHLSVNYSIEKSSFFQLTIIAAKSGSFDRSEGRFIKGLSDHVCGQPRIQFRMIAIAHRSK